MEWWNVGMLGREQRVKGTFRISDCGLRRKHRAERDYFGFRISDLLKKSGVRGKAWCIEHGHGGF